MNYQNPRVAETAELLKGRLPELENKAEILRAVELGALFDEIKTLAPEERGVFGKEVNVLRQELEGLVQASQIGAEQLSPIDVTAPFDVNTPADQQPKLLPSEQGSTHPLMTELASVLDIFYRMGFTAVE